VVAVPLIDNDGDSGLDILIDKSDTTSGQTGLLLSSANQNPHALVSEVGCQFFSG
jgi:hypothetical protein